MIGIPADLVKLLRPNAGCRSVLYQLSSAGRAYHLLRYIVNHHLPKLRHATILIAVRNIANFENMSPCRGLQRLHRAAFLGITTWARACFPGCIGGAEAEHVGAKDPSALGRVRSGEDARIYSLLSAFPEPSNATYGDQCTSSGPVGVG